MHQPPASAELRLAVIGSRSVRDYDVVDRAITQAVEHFTWLGPLRSIISGGADGVDSLAALWAHQHDVPVVEFKPNWHRHPYARFKNLAIVTRNRQIVAACTALLAVWDGISPGTKMTLGFAEADGRPTLITYTGARLKESTMATLVHDVITGKANLVLPGTTPPQDVANLVQLMNDPAVVARVNALLKEHPHA
jgi:predicted Rossmann fold nucleotide-binding protein DprA/Smf involved in DNA uptake